MRTTSRTVMLGLVLAVAVGCGGSGTPDQAKAPAPDAPKPQPKPEITPAPQPETTTIAVQQPDTTAQQATKTPPPPVGTTIPEPSVVPMPRDAGIPARPTTPVTGTLGGKAFTPVVTFQGDTLTFRVANPDATTDREIEVKLTAEQLKKATGGGLVVTREQATGPDVPEVMTTIPDRKPSPLISFAGGYALTLALGTKAGGKLPGTIDLTLPGDDGSKVAGTFDAAVSRPVTELPGADDAPFVQGKVAAANVTAEVRVGYIRFGDGGVPVLDVLQMPFAEPGPWSPSNMNKPRVSLLVAGGKGQPGRYEHTKLPAGRYLVFASAVGGPAVWKWVTIDAGTQAAADLDLDAARVGGLTVTVPAGTTGTVFAAPADDGGKAWEDGHAISIATALESSADLKGTMATFAKLGPGKYEVRAGTLSGSVVVTAGQNATVELK